jgi:GTP-binding protein
MEKLGTRRGDLLDMIPDGKGRVRLDYLIPTRALIGFRTEFLTATSGTGMMHHIFDHYGPAKKGSIAARLNGVMLSNGPGKSTGFSLFNLQERGRMIIPPQTEVYEGMIVGIHSRDNDLVVNVVKGKQLTNMRASGSDEKLTLEPYIQFSLEQALEFVEDDELVEVTPKSIRLRKKFLKEHERKRTDRAK